MHLKALEAIWENLKRFEKRNLKMFFLAVFTALVENGMVLFPNEKASLDASDRNK